MTIESADYDSFKTRSSTIHELFEEFNRHQSEFIRLKSKLGESDDSEDAGLSDSISDKYYHILIVYLRMALHRHLKLSLNNRLFILQLNCLNLVYLFFRYFQGMAYF